MRAGLWQGVLGFNRPRSKPAITRRSRQKQPWPEQCARGL